ncbi:MAG: SRPBCC family protein [Adhaeribacter sp.]
MLVGGDDENQFLHICRIAEVISGQKLTHTWQYEGQPEETFITFELFPEGDRTRLKLTHAGLEKIAAYDPMFAKENFVAGWTNIIGYLLRDFVEKTSAASL